MKYLVGLLSLFFCHTLFAQALILQTEISPNGEKIAFTYQGDIWTVSSLGGRADRLSIHEGYESSPLWSHDGDFIAFNSDRFGNNDVFTIPAQGGRPKRLTYHSASDTVTDVTPENNVLFSSRRIYAQVEREPEIHSINAISGVSESRFIDALGLQASVSPDGKKVAFVRSTARVSREDYRGPANRNIWIYDIAKNEYKQLSKHAGADIMPKWVSNDMLYFISPRSGKYNLHSITLKGKTKQLTDEKEFGLNHFSTDADGQLVVYQAGDKVMRLDLEKGKSTVLDIDVKSDFRFDPQVSKTKANAAEEFAVSPDGSLSAYVLRGDIYVSRNDKKDKRSVRLSQGAARDRDVRWLNDETLLFVSDKAGQNDIYKITSLDENESNLFYSLKHSVTRLTFSEGEESNPVVAPNGKRIAYSLGRGTLITADISEQGEMSNPITLLNGWDTPSGVTWSPDSEWLAYSLSDLSFNEEIYIHAADNSSAPVNVSMHPKYDINPVWSPDGSKLGFSSMRNNGDFDIWFVWLNKKDWQRSKEEWKRASFRKDKKDKNDKKEKAKEKSDGDETIDIAALDETQDKVKEGEQDATETEEPAKAIQIDFENIYKRLEQVTRFPGNESELSFDQEGEFIYYSIGGNGRQNFELDRSLYKIKWDGEDKKTVLKGDSQARDLRLAEEGKYLFALSKGGKIVRVSTKDDKSATLNISSEMKIDYEQELAQIFDDAWRALNAGFYDPNFHGKDWQKLKEKYRPIALKASTKEDFQYIFNLMLGQLNASHMGLFRGENPKQTQKQRTGLLGIEGQHLAEGFKITSVLPNSPADKDESKLNKGDVITAINQKSLQIDGTNSSDTNMPNNFYSYLLNRVNQPVLLNVRNAQVDREVVIWPTESLSNELYDDWVEERRRLTEQYSKGRLGYLHIRGMNWSSFERFERELMAAGYGKEGIVIDVRYNGGGWTTDYLMAVLNVKQHAYTIPRGAAKDLSKEHKKFRNNYPYSERLPLSAWTKPSIAISNENSYSNAEIFSHAYKALGLGKLVGRPTFGAVISTGGYRLVDGSLVRMPFRGWWVKESGKNMDFTPAEPDIEVTNPPAYKAKGIDPQLKRAVSELLKDL